MGNICDHQRDMRLKNEGELPLRELFYATLEENAYRDGDGSVSEGSSEGGQSSFRARSSDKSYCATGESEEHRIVYRDGRASVERVVEDYVTQKKAFLGCLDVMNADHSEGEDELDFSNDRQLHAKRAPAVSAGLDPALGDLGVPRLKQTFKMNNEATPTKAESAGAQLGAQSGDGSFYIHHKPHLKGAPSESNRRPAPTLQRSNSSYLVTQQQQAALKGKFPRTESTAIGMKSLPRSDSSYIFTQGVNRSQSAPPRGPATGPLVQELTCLGNGLPDPSTVPLRGQVCKALGISEALASIEEMHGFQGGQNQGMWELQDGGPTLILKLVEGKRKVAGLPTEGEQFMKIMKEQPGIRSDPALAFPIKVLRCHSGSRLHDLIVMLKAPGTCLTEVITKRWKTKQVSQLMQLLTSLGQFLANFHNRYNMQHGDFQTSNIFYDETTRKFTLIDVGGMDNTIETSDNDVEHFGEILRMLGKSLKSNDFYATAFRSFQAGYKTAKC